MSSLIAITMFYDSILLRSGEIFLKGKNRNIFENKLISNIKKITKISQIKQLRSRYIVDYFDDHKKLKKVFGLTSYSLALSTNKELENIKKKSLEILKDKKCSFKIETKRSDKTFPIKSPDLNVLIGKHVEEHSSLKFDFKNPQITLTIEINQNGTYLFTKAEKCFGGLPTGVEGKVILLVENPASVLAGLMFMKRGCSVIPVSFNENDISLLQQFSPEKIDLKIVKDFNELEKFSSEKKIDVLVVGDNFENRKDYSVDLLIFRTLIAFSDKEIVENLEEFSS
jgi:tRNA uracil 4-sulfurtransferase